MNSFKIRTGLLLCFGAIASLFFACDSSEQIAGTDTGNPVLVATVKDSLGHPLAKASVVVYQTVETQAGTASPIPWDTLYTDSLGRISIDSCAKGEIALEVYWQDRLGLFQKMAVDSARDSILLTAGQLVPFPVEAVGQDSVVATLAETGRQLLAGSTTLIPPGVWNVQYVRFLTDSVRTFPRVDVRVEDARETPRALEGLASAVRIMDSLDIERQGYVALSELPQDSFLVDKLFAICEDEGFTHAEACRSDSDCRIWQWQSDWVVAEDASKSVLVAAITFGGKTQCVFFSSERTNGISNYGIDQVRKGP
jgi:hypothetical protein